MEEATSIVVLSGAGGGSLDLMPFREQLGETTNFEVLRYPNWRRYLRAEFDFVDLVEELVDRIEEVVPRGPIRIIGFSIGAHFGYAASIVLQQRGREVSHFYAVDSFMVHSAAASDGWLRRFVGRCRQLIDERRLSELALVFRSRLWRFLLRLAQGHLIAVVRVLTKTRVIETILRADPLLEQELNMRLLIQMGAPGFAEIDVAPEALLANAILLRTAHNAHCDEAWRRRCPTIHIGEIPGDHESIFERQTWPSVATALLTAKNLENPVSHVQ